MFIYANICMLLFYKNIKIKHQNKILRIKTKPALLYRFLQRILYVRLVKQLQALDIFFA